MYLRLKPTQEQIAEAILKIMDDIHEQLPKINNVYLLAHNGGKFDFKVLLGTFLKMAAQEKVLIDSITANADHEIFQIEITHVKSEVKFTLRDSYKVLSSSADQIAKLFLGGDGKIHVNHNILNKELIKITDDLET